MGKMASKNWLVKKKQQDRAKEQWNMGIHCWYVLSRVLAWLSPGLGQAQAPCVRCRGNYCCNRKKCLNVSSREQPIAAYSSRQLGDHLFWLQSPTFRADTGHHRPLQPGTPLTITAVLLVCFALSISLLQDRLKQWGRMNEWSTE